MYSVFEELLNAKGVTAYKVSKATGISTATLSEWKNGKYTTKEDKLTKIAEYFGVSTEYLKTGKDTRFSDENAHLVALIRADERLNSALATRGGLKKGGNIALMIMFFLAFIIGFTNAEFYGDLKVWASWCFLCAAIAMISFNRQRRGFAE